MDLVVCGGPSSMDVCVAVEEKSVHLLTWDGYWCRSVPLSIIERIREHLIILPGNYIATKCPSIAVLDLLIRYLSDLPLEDEDFYTILQLLEVAFQYKLTGLSNEALDHILKYIDDDPHLALKTYLEMQSLLEWWAPELKSLMGDLNEIYPIYITFASEEEERHLVELRKAKLTFERISYVFNIKAMDVEDYSEEILVDCEAFKLILKHMEGDLGVKYLNEPQLMLIIRWCYRLGYRRLFCEAIMHLEDVNELMAEDLYNFYLMTDFTHSEVVRAFDKLSLKWRSGEEVLIHIFTFKRGRNRSARSSDLMASFAFLPRNLLEEKLQIFLSRNTFRDISKAFDSLNIVDYFRDFLQNEEIINSITDYKILRQLLQLGASLEFGSLYFKTYLAILNSEPGIDTDHFPTLYCHRFTEEEIKSPLRDCRLVTLKAADKSRLKIHRETLKNYSKFFEELLSVYENEEGLEIPCTECKDKDVLEGWQQFMVTGKLEWSGFVLRNVEIGRVSIELMHVADFYMIPDLMVAVLNRLKLRIDYINAAAIYNALPMFHLSSEISETITNVKDKIEGYYIMNVCRLPRFLNMAPFDLLLLMASQITDPETINKVLKVYVEHNKETWQEDGHHRMVNIETNRDLFNLPMVAKGVKSLCDRDPVLEVLINKLTTRFRYTETSILGSSINDLILFTSELTSEVVHFNVVKENEGTDEVLKCLINLNDLWSVSQLNACIVGRKLIVWNLHGVISVINIDDRQETKLSEVLGTNYAIVYWKDKLVAICKTEGPNLIFNAADNKWDTLLVPDLYPLNGSPLVIGDRLYVQEEGEQWVRYIKPWTEPAMEIEQCDEYDEDVHYNFVTDYITPPPSGPSSTEPAMEIESSGPSLTEEFFQLNFREIRVAHEIKSEDRVYLIRSHDVLIYDTSMDHMQFVERRELPKVPVLDAIVINAQLFCLLAGSTLKSASVYQFDCIKWTLQLRSELKNVRLVYNRYGFVRNN